MRRARSPAERNGPTATASRRITATATTGDEARPGHPSILDAANRAWLTADFGVRFCTIPSLRRA